MDDEQLHAFFSFRWSRLSEEEKVAATQDYRWSCFEPLMAGTRTRIFRSVMGEQFPGVKLLLDENLCHRLPDTGPAAWNRADSHTRSVPVVSAPPRSHGETPIDHANDPP